LSHHTPLPGPPAITLMSFKRNESSHRLLEPLVDPPIAIGAALRDARRAAVGAGRAPPRPPSRTGLLVDAAMPSSLLEGFVDRLGKLGVRHGARTWGKDMGQDPSKKTTSRCVVGNRAGESSPARGVRHRRRHVAKRDRDPITSSLSRRGLLGGASTTAFQESRQIVGDMVDVGRRRALRAPQPSRNTSRVCSGHDQDRGHAELMRHGEVAREVPRTSRPCRHRRCGP